WVSPPSPDRVVGVNFAPDGRSFVMRTESSMYRFEQIPSKRGGRDWDFRLTADQRGGLPFGTGDACYSPDGKVLYTCSEIGPFMAWDAATLRPLRAWGGETLFGLGLSAIALTPDGKTLVTAAGDEQTVRLWDAASGGEHFSRTGHRGPVNWLS